MCFYVCISMMLAQTAPVRSKWGGGAASVCHSGPDWWGDKRRAAIVAWQYGSAFGSVRCTQSASSRSHGDDSQERWWTWGWQKWREGVRDEVDAVMWEGRRKKGGGVVENGFEGRTSAWRTLACLHLCVAERDRGVRGVLELPVIALTLPFLVLLSDVPFSSSLHYLFLSSFNPHPLLHFPIPFLSPFSSSSFFFFSFFLPIMWSVAVLPLRQSHVGPRSPKRQKLNWQKLVFF